MIEFDFSWIELQGRSVKGSTLTAHKIDRVINAPKIDDADLEIETVEKALVPSEKSKAPESAKAPEEKDQGTFNFESN